MDILDDDARGAVTAAGITQYNSPFACSDYSPEHHDLIAPFRPSNYRP